MTPDGARRSASMKSTYTQYTGFNNFEDLGPCDRCIARGPLGSMFPVVYNNGNQIFQAPGLVVLRNEMIHETRIIPLDGRPHVGKSIRSYMGDSRGRWDGNTRYAMFVYACHEGNYAMTDILSASRADGRAKEK
jgi:hypothetical protein